MPRALLPILAAALVVSVGCAPEPGERAGDPDVYRRLSAATDCAFLQRQFDDAMDRVEQLPPASPKREAPMGYASTAMERMQELDCQ